MVRLHKLKTSFQSSRDKPVDSISYDVNVRSVEFGCRAEIFFTPDDESDNCREDAVKRYVFFQNGKEITSGHATYQLVNATNVTSIGHPGKEHRGDFICRVFSEAGCTADVRFRIHVRVHIDTLWPLLGIIVQALLVSVIILVAEVRRRRKRRREAAEAEERRKKAGRNKEQPTVRKERKEIYSGDTAGIKEA